MTEDIHNFLSNQYKVMLSTNIIYIVYDKMDGSEIRINDILQILLETFSMEEAKIKPILNEWIEKNVIFIENKKQELKLVTTTLDVKQLNRFLDQWSTP